MASKFGISLYFIIPVLIVFIVECFICYMHLKEFYQLSRIPFLPPGWIFGIVWIVLFVLMCWGGYSYYTNQKNPESQVNFLNLFYTQLLFNFLWVLIFFGSPGYQAGRFALMILLFLIINVIAIVLYSWNTSQLCSWFFIGYSAWLVFAVILNAAFLYTYPVQTNDEDSINISQVIVKRRRYKTKSNN